MKCRWILPFVLACACALVCATLALAAPRTTGIPPLNQAYRLPVTPDMPEWAKLLYRSDVEVDVEAIDRAYERWEEAREAERALRGPASGIPDFEEDLYEEYYSKWRRAVQQYWQPDGSYDFTRTPRERVQSTRTPATALQANASTWTYLGPERMIPNTLADPAQPKLMYQANIYAFDVSPQAPNLVYAGSETGVLSKSVDKGLTWSPIGVNNSALKAPITSVAISPVDTANVYAATPWGVVRTGNGGTTWTIDFNRPSLIANDLKVKPDSSAVVFAAGDLLWRRTAASVWSPIIARPSYDVEFRPTQPSVVYALVKNAAGTRCEFFKSTNGGLTFSIRQTGWIGALGDGGGRLAVTAADPSRVYAVLLTSSGSRVLRSRDSGETWAVIGSSDSLEYGQVCTPGPLGMSTGQGFYDLSIAASQTDTNSVVVGTTTAYRTTNGGATWSPVGGWICGSIPMHPDVQEFKTIGGDSWVATDGGLMLSTDFWGSPANASARTERMRGLQIWGFAQGWNEDLIIGSAYHNGVFVRREGWPAGTFMNIGGGEPATGYMNPMEPDRAYFSSPCNFVLPKTTTDPYSVWFTNLYPNESYVGLQYSEQAWDPRYGDTYYLGNKRRFYRTFDGGSNFDFTISYSDTNARIEHIEVSRSNPNVVFMTARFPGLGGDLLRSSNGGKTWSVCPPPPGLSVIERLECTISLSGTDENTIWLAFRSGFSDHKVYKSTDGGQTWTNWSTNALLGFVVGDMVHQLGTDGGVYLYCDDGYVFWRDNTSTDWTDISAGLPWQLNASQCRLGIQYKAGKLRMATPIGYWERDLVGPSATLVQPMVSKRSSCLGDTLQFDSYSVTNGPGTYAWSFDPAPQWVSDPLARNPRVVLGAKPGPFHATLTVTDANGTATRTLRNLVSNGGAPRWATSVIGYSSQYETFGWAAIQALGEPDVYPAHGDIGLAWASLNSDDQPEYLQLGFADPAPINFVQVVETYKPGALVKVSARNPNTSQMVTLWEGAASVRPDSSRAFTVRFPTTSFSVSEVRLDFDSPAVPDWNEVDAVGIGRDLCAADIVAVDETPVTQPTGLLRWARPNPFTRDVNIAFVQTHYGHVRAEVFDVTGQRVRVIVDGTFAPGQHETRWDGLDRTGRAVAPGLYYLRLQSGGRTESRKLVKLW
ncbi:MAG: T9SS type A sorting domain-containing protein [Candidatus Eisenbacteria bacterium]|nr:T9SS type A sorting domain-containing protein [Candidatus Eisenbacteria bacterium]